MSHILQRTAATLGLLSATLLLSATAASARTWHDPDPVDVRPVRTVVVTEQRLTPDELALGALVGVAFSGAGLLTVTVASRRHFSLFAFHF